AIQTNHMPLIQLFIDHGADVDFIDDNKNSPLSYAIQMKSESIVSLLIEHGADVNFVDIFNVSLLTYAINEQEFGVVKLLVDHGADVNFVAKNSMDNDKMEPLFLYAICKDSELPLVQYLLEHGATYDFKSEGSLCTLMPHLFIGFRVEILEYLLESKINIQDLTLKTLKDLIWRDRDELLRILIKHGLDVELSDEEGNTLL
ncbi:hypothetical protein PIROE2DRAFT_28605, partial [Piromyces sp. E2]